MKKQFAIYFFITTFIFINLFILGGQVYAGETYEELHCPTITKIEAKYYKAGELVNLTSTTFSQSSIDTIVFNITSTDPQALPLRFYTASYLATGKASGEDTTDWTSNNIISLNVQQALRGNAWVQIRVDNNDGFSCMGDSPAFNFDTYQNFYYNVVATPVTCTSFVYSDWSTCQSNNTKTRSIISSSPNGCSGGNPALTQSCTYTPTCTTDTWISGDWGACSADRIQTRTNTKTFDCEFADTPEPSVSQSCVPKSIPIITSITPSTIYNGTSITVNGSRFMNLEQYQYSCYNCKVFINGQEIKSIYSWSWYEDRVSFTIPNDAQSGYVQIQDSKGNLSNKFNIAVSQDPATILPVISSVNPRTITPGDTISISGSSFGSSQGSSQLSVGGYSLGKIISWNDNEIRYQTSSLYDTTSGKIGVKKCKSYYDCLNIVYGGYLYIQPQITSLDTGVGREGMKITIFGKYLKNDNVSSDNSTKYSINVYFNGTRASYPQNGIWTSGTIEVVVPRGATSGIVTLEITADNVSDKVTANGPYFNILEKISGDEYSDLQDYFKQINLPQSWGLASNRRMINVAVIDDGVYNNHPDLKNKMWENTDEIIGNGIDDDRNGYIDDHYGWDFINNTSDVTPEGSHGTQVAGIIGAEKDNEIGIAGVNSNVKIMPLIVCASSGCMDYSKAIRYAVDNGAEVINLSLGTRAVSGYTTAVNDAIEYAYQHNVLIVTAAGNGDTVGGIGFDLTQIPQSPVCNNDQKGNRVIGVGAADSKNYRTQWSNYGSCVDIWAPGVDIISTTVPIFSSTGDFYEKGNGTSFSAPIVTGIISLLKASYSTITSQEAINLLTQNSNNGTIDAYKTLSANFVPAYTQAVSTPPMSNAFTARPNGTLIRPTNSPNIYLIEQGKSRYIPNYNIFIANGFSASNVITITPDELIQYSAGEPLSAPIPEGALIRAIGDIDIYIIKYMGTKKFKRLVLSPSVFKSYGHLKWKNVINVSKSMVDSFTTAELVRAVNDTRIYKLYPVGDKGQKRLIKNSDVLARLGFDADSIYEINSFDRGSYITGSVLE